MYHCISAYAETSGSLFETMNGEQENEFIIVVIVASMDHSFSILGKPRDSDDDPWGRFSLPLS